MRRSRPSWCVYVRQPQSCRLAGWTCLADSGERQNMCLFLSAGSSSPPLHFHVIPGRLQDSFWSIHILSALREEKRGRGKKWWRIFNSFGWVLRLIKQSLDDILSGLARETCRWKIICDFNCSAFGLLEKVALGLFDLFVWFWLMLRRLAGKVWLLILSDSDWR